MLGRPYSISGKIIHGDKRGSEIGFPTANIKLKPNILLSGVYAVFTYIDGKKYYAINIWSSFDFFIVMKYLIFKRMSL